MAAIARKRGWMPHGIWAAAINVFGLGVTMRRPLRWLLWEKV